MTSDAAIESVPLQASASHLPRIAAALAIAFVALVWGGIFLRGASAAIGPLLGQGIGPTGAAFLTPVALVAAIGLWARARWGWWFALIVIAYQTMSYILFLMVVLASGDATGILTWLTGAWLLATLVVVLLPETRRACAASA